MAQNVKKGNNKLSDNQKEKRVHSSFFLKSSMSVMAKCLKQKVNPKCSNKANFSDNVPCFFSFI